MANHSTRNVKDNNIHDPLNNICSNNYVAVLEKRVTFHLMHFVEPSLIRFLGRKHKGEHRIVVLTPLQALNTLTCAFANKYTYVYVLLYVYVKVGLVPMHLSTDFSLITQLTHSHSHLLAV